MISQIGKSIEHDKPYIYVAETPLKVTVCRWKAVMLAVEMDAFNVCAMQTVIARSLGWRFASATTLWPKFVSFNRKWCGKSCSKRIFNSIRSPNGQMTHLASTIFLFLNVDWGQNRLCQSLVDMKHAPIAHTHTRTSKRTALGASYAIWQIQKYQLFDGCSSLTTPQALVTLSLLLWTDTVRLSEFSRNCFFFFVFIRSALFWRTQIHYHIPEALAHTSNLVHIKWKMCTYSENWWVTYGVSYERREKKKLKEEEV